MLRKLARSTWQVMEVSLDTHTCTVMEGLTEDAVSARIHKGEAAGFLLFSWSCQILSAFSGIVASTRINADSPYDT